MLLKLFDLMKIIALNTYTPDINDFAYEWNPKRLCKAIST